MRDTRFFSTAFAAALASMLGLGSGSATELSGRPETYQSETQAGQTLPLWLVRYKLRLRGFQDIFHVRSGHEGLVVDAHDRWGRMVRLFVDPHSGDVVPRAGFGLAHLKHEDVPRHLAALGYQCLAPVAYRDAHYQVMARDEAGTLRRLGLDPLTGAIWFS